jgi:hypothetical protein
MIIGVLVALEGLSGVVKTVDTERLRLHASKILSLSESSLRGHPYRMSALEGVTQKRTRADVGGVKITFIFYFSLYIQFEFKSYSCRGR